MRFLKRHPALLSVPAILLLWALASQQGWLGRTVLASPKEVFDRLVSALRPDAPRESAVFRHAWHTILLAISGWGLALGLGVVVGLAMGSRKVVYLAGEPLIEFARGVPPLLAFPLFLVAYNFDRQAYVWTIVFGCMPVMVLAVARGIQTMDLTRLEILAVHRVGKAVRLFAAVMEIFPSAFLGARITFSMSLVIAVVSEMVFTPRTGLALGSLAKDAEISFDTATFYACIVTIGVYGYLCNVVLRRIERWLKGGGRDEEM